MHTVHVSRSWDKYKDSNDVCLIEFKIDTDSEMIFNGNLWVMACVGLY